VKIKGRKKTRKRPTVRLVKRLRVSALFLGIDMPHNVVGKANDLVASALCHLSKAFGLGLVLERVARKIDAYDAQTSQLSSIPLMGVSGFTYLTGGRLP
jgi:hypothetical protein